MNVITPKDLIKDYKFKFLGTFDSSKQYDIGDVVVKDGEPHVLITKSEWLKTETVSKLFEEEISKPERLIKLECSSCGGQLVKMG